MLTKDQLICTRCFCLTSVIQTCYNCHDSLPLSLCFSPDKQLARLDRFANSTCPDPSIVKATILDARVQMSKYDHLIGCLIASRETLSSYILFQKAKLSAIKRLPPEILVYILTLAIQGPNIYCSLLPSVKLSQVCTSWRRLMISTPSLWTNIVLSSVPRRSHRRRFLTASVNLARYHLEVLELYLTRSGPHPLQIQLSLDGCYSAANSDSRGSYDIIRALADQAHRWEHLEIRGSEVAKLPLSVGDRCHALKTLRITGPSLQDPEMPRRCEIFARAPLVSVDLGFQRIEKFALPADNPITHFTMEAGFPSQLPLPASLASRLRFLCVASLNATHSAGRQRASLPVLEKLVVSGGTGNIFTFMSVFHCPSLRVLSINRAGYSLASESEDALLGAIPEMQSFDLLTTLSLTDCYLSLPQLMAALRSFRSLRILTLNSLRGHSPHAHAYVSDRACIISSTFFRAFLDEDLGILPCLEDLNISTGERMLDESVLRTFINLRTTAGSTIHRMKLTFYDATLSYRTLKWLRESDFGGRQVLVRHQGGVGTHRYTTYVY